MAEPEPSTTALLAAATTGDQAAWAMLVDRFLPLVHAVTRAHRLDRHTAEEVNGEVWLRLVENLGRLREPEALPGWLRTTTHRECLRASRRTREASLDWPLPPADPVPAPDADLLAQELTRLVGEALDRLSATCQSLLRVFAFSPDTAYTEIASSLGMPIGSVGPTRTRCLGHLRKRLESVGYLAARG